MEYSESGHFEDHCSYFAVQRNFEPRRFQRKEFSGAIELETERFHLIYRGGPFAPASLEISVKGGTEAWHPGLEDPRNLGGTFRTLDEVGSAKDLGHGILSRSGWSFVDDSKSILFSDEAKPWALPRTHPENLDWYFFAYAKDYRGALKDFCAVSGKIPLPPRFAFGSWYSRYWPYSSEDFLAIAKDYGKQGFPLDVMVIDMDWHRKGWTGYSWNDALIPDAKALLKGLHEAGLKTTLNLHPADGVAEHEDAYATFCKAMGLPADGKTVPFEISDPKFAKAYFEALLHPLEKEGVDFWWMDWQQGTKTKIEGLDPLTWLNYTHFLDRERLENRAFPDSKLPKRGMNFSRWGGLGDHRYPVHFSGDTHANWEILEFLAPFTATGGNVGVTYWSHDIGGHFATVPNTNPELLTRWIQFGALSPVLRVHSSRDKGNDRRPWMFGEPFTSAMRKAYRLRKRLVPYIYSAARQCYDEGLPLLRPMYLEYPENPEAYEKPGQYFFGPDLLVAPLARPGIGAAKLAHALVWLPEGDWYAFESGEHFRGPKELALPLGLEEMAIFVRGGAPIPLEDGFLLFPGPGAKRILYEDDGESIGYAEGAYRTTPLESRIEAGSFWLDLGPSQGAYHGAPSLRSSTHVHSPGNLAQPIELEASDLQDTVSLKLGRLPSDDLQQVHSRMEEAHRCLLHLSLQLEGLDPAKRVLLLRLRLEEVLKTLVNERDFSRLQADCEALLGELEDFKERLLETQEETFEPARRCAAGWSIHTLSKPAQDPLRRILEIEILREKPQAGRIQFEMKLESEAPRQFRQVLGEKHRETIYLEFEAKHQLLRQEALQIDMLFENEFQNLKFKESLLWNANTIRDWLVLGPLENGKGPDPASFSKEIVTKIVYSKKDGAELRWKRHRFDPVGMMRGIREIYDFGEILLCPEGEVFAATYVESAEAGAFRVGLGHEGKATLWINGEELSPKEGHYEAQLQAGRNVIVLRLRNMRRKGGGFGLSLEANGRPLHVHDPASLHPEIA